MRPVPVRVLGDVDLSIGERVTALFHETRTLADLLRWTNAQRPIIRVLEIVTQDEFTHDVVVPFGSAFLSFDTT